MTLLQIIVFLSAFLLFQIELIVSKAMLPGFGGSYLVFSVNMAFFQGLLLAGYYYVAAADRRWPLRKVFPAHLLILLLSLAVFPMELNRLSQPGEGQTSVTGMVWLLLRSVGPVFFMLATTSVMAQKILAESELPQRDNPYRLYAVSNLGSVLALLTYPFIVEPLLELRTQALVWQTLYVVLIALHLPLWRLARQSRVQETCPDTASGPRITRRRKLRWFLLAAAGSAMFLAVTNMITLNLPATPLIWIFPLSVYLVTFILNYKRKQFYPSWMAQCVYLPCAAAVAMFVLISQKGFYPGLPLLLAAHLAILFFISMAAHGELARDKPGPVGELTGYYLVIASGGFAGSALVSWMAPLVFNAVVEYLMGPLLLFAALALAAPPATASLPRKITLFAFPPATLVSVAALGYYFHSRITNPAVLAALAAILVLFIVARKHSTAIAAALALLIIAAASSPWQKMLFKYGDLVLMRRDYYTIYKIYDSNGLRYLDHGVTIHGAQALGAGPDRVPLGYFHPSTPIGEIMTKTGFNFSRVGIIGLGTGSLAAYGQPGQIYDFYELDPENGELARQYFTYLAKSQAQVNLIFGDGRLELSRSGPETVYDIFIIDAFNSDSIPAHLITVEALAEYRRHLRPDGVIVFHLTNAYLELWHVLNAEANQAGLTALIKNNIAKTHPNAYPCIWAALTADHPKTDRLLTLGFVKLEGAPTTRKVKPWTDNYGNIFSALAWPDFIVRIFPGAEKKTAP